MLANVFRSKVIKNNVRVRNPIALVRVGCCLLHHRLGDNGQTITKERIIVIVNVIFEPFSQILRSHVNQPNRGLDEIAVIAGPECRISFRIRWPPFPRIGKRLIDHLLCNDGAVGFAIVVVINSIIVPDTTLLAKRDVSRVLINQPVVVIINLVA